MQNFIGYKFVYDNNEFICNQIFYNDRDNYDI